jgi:hypothetical protein
MELGDSFEETAMKKVKEDTGLILKFYEATQLVFWKRIFFPKKFPKQLKESCRTSHLEIPPVFCYNSGIKSNRRWSSPKPPAG